MYVNDGTWIEESSALNGAKVQESRLSLTEVRKVKKVQYYHPLSSSWPGGVVFAAAAESLQSCPILCDPIDSSPPGSPIPGILQARTLEWVASSFSNAWMWKVKVKSLSRVWLFATPWTVAYQAPPSMGFSRKEYWSVWGVFKFCKTASLYNWNQTGSLCKGSVISATVTSLAWKFVCCSLKIIIT